MRCREASFLELSRVRLALSSLRFPSIETERSVEAVVKLLRKHPVAILVLTRLAILTGRFGSVTVFQ